MGQEQAKWLLISAIEQQTKQLQAKYPTILIEHFGGPSVSVYNARVQKDSILT